MRNMFPEPLVAIILSFALCVSGGALLFADETEQDGMPVPFPWPEWFLSLDEDSDSSGSFHNPAAFFPTDVLTGDLDGNGIPDLVSINWRSGSVSVLIDNGTPGSFSPPGFFPAGIRPFKGVLADFNNDDVMDVVGTNYNAPGALFVLPGQLIAGAFSFLPAVSIPVAFPYPTDIVAGLFNADALLDVAVIWATTGAVSVFPNAGAFSFGAPVDYFLVPASTPAGLASADFNNDGDADLAVSDFEGRIHVLLADGAGGFTVDPFVPPLIAGGYLDSIACGDVDNDGNVDCVVTQRGTARIHRLTGNGDGSFVSVVLCCPTLYQTTLRLWLLPT